MAKTLEILTELGYPADGTTWTRASGNDFAGIEWVSNPPITEAAFEAKRSELDARSSAAVPDVPSAYSALLLSAVFQRVDALADSSIPIGKAYSKIGMNFAASAGVGWPAVVAPLNASIAELDTKLTSAGEGFTAGEKTWIEDWNATHNLGLTLPWGA